MSARSNAIQRAVRRYNGDDTYTIFIDAAVAQGYVLDQFVPTAIQILDVTVKLASGTVTLNVQKVVGVTTSSLTGLSAIAATATEQTVAATQDGTPVLNQGDTLQITASSPSTPVGAAISIRYRKVSGNQ